MLTAEAGPVANGVVLMEGLNLTGKASKPAHATSNHARIRQAVRPSNSKPRCLIERMASIARVLTLF